MHVSVYTVIVLRSSYARSCLGLGGVAISKVGSSVPAPLRPANVSHDPFEIIQQGLEAVNDAVIVERACVDFPQGPFGTLGRRHGVPPCFWPPDPRR